MFGSFVIFFCWVGAAITGQCSAIYLEYQVVTKCLLTMTLISFNKVISNCKITEVPKSPYGLSYYDISKGTDYTLDTRNQ